ncbi:MAG: GTP-binding protein [Burkholderiales bacterium]|nr:GTP-binding protein [Burkholderiales bacterium]
MSRAIPVTLLTGYLGSGKTTLLTRLLAHPDLHNTAVLVNELGEIAIDHDLLVRATESIVLLDRGCLCCALRTDLAQQLDDLYTRRMRKDIPAFDRVVIETTGLADPAPILQTLVAEPILATLYRLDGVVTTADAQLGEQTLDAHFESLKQAALADRIVLTKIDLVDDARIARLEARLHELNPAAPIARAAGGAIDPAFLIDIGVNPARSQNPGLDQWLRTERYLPIPGKPSALSRGARHDERIRSFALLFDAPISGTRLWQALEALIERSGDKLLRVKGIVNVTGQAQPKVIHIVQHVLYPVLSLPAWPSEDRRTRLVFIVRDLEPAEVIAHVRRGVDATPPPPG